MKDFETKFKLWFRIVEWKDKKFEKETSWDWASQIFAFIKNPDKELKRANEYAEMELSDMEDTIFKKDSNFRKECARKLHIYLQNLEKRDTKKDN